MNLTQRPLRKRRRRKSSASSTSSTSSVSNSNQRSDGSVRTGDGRHRCSYCNKSFVQNCHLARHIREKHASSRPSFECLICNKDFNQRSNLKVHLRSHALDESVSRPW